MRIMFVKVNKNNELVDEMLYDAFEVGTNQVQLENGERLVELLELMVINLDGYLKILPEISNMVDDDFKEIA